MENLPKQTVCEETIHLLHRQRHDFLNHIQVVYAYLQLGKVEKALTYLDGVIVNKDSIDQLIAEYECSKESTCKHG